MDGQAPRAALYCRQSRTEAGDTSPSLKGQQADLEALAANRGWLVAGIFIDADAPADDIERRERWMACLEMADAGGLDLVAAWDTSRLWRSLELKIATFKQLQRAGVETVATMSGDYGTDPDRDPESSFLSNVMAAATEYDNRMRRMKSMRGQQHSAENGVPWGSSVKPWGYQRGTKPDGTPTFIVDKDEEPYVLEAVRRVLQGEPCHKVEADFRARGLRGPNGGVWTAGALRVLLRAPHLAGLRTRGDRRSEHVVYGGNWDGIISVDDHERLKALLPKTHRPTRRRHLLSGLAVCGREGCTGTIAGGGRDTVGGHPQYRCSEKREGWWSGCGITIQSGPLEAHVRDQVLAKITHESVGEYIRKAASDDDEVRSASEQISTLAARRSEVGQLVAEGALDAVAARAATRRLDELEADAQRRLSKVSDGRVELLTAAVDDPHQWWEAANLDDRRRLLDCVLEKVIVYPAADLIDRPCWACGRQLPRDAYYPGRAGVCRDCIRARQRERRRRAKEGLPPLTTERRGRRFDTRRIEIVFR